MAPIAFAPNVTRSAGSLNRERELLGVRRARPAVDTHVSATSITKGKRVASEPVVVASAVQPIKTQPSEFEKVVRRIPTLYVIAFFGVVVICAVFIIWNTLQVNRLTLEKTRLEDRIAQTEQRLTKLRAEEMQLSAPSRIRDIAHDKLGMVEANGDELVIVH